MLNKFSCKQYAICNVLQAICYVCSTGLAISNMIYAICNVLYVTCYIQCAICNMLYAICCMLGRMYHALNSFRSFDAILWLFLFLLLLAEDKHTEES